MSRDTWVGIGLTIAGAGIGLIGGVLGKTAAVITGCALFAIGAGIIILAQFRGEEKGWFSFKVPGEIHRYIAPKLIIRNCGPRTVRRIRFDPIQSRQGYWIRLDEVASLASGEKARIGFHAGDNAEYVGVTGHLAVFFEEGSIETDQPAYVMTIRFLDGEKERTEQHSVEGHPRPKGGIDLKITPALKPHSPLGRD